MKLKKLAAITLGLTMAMSMTAYANDADAMAVYQEMEAVSSAMTDVDAYYDFNMTMSTEATGDLKARVEMNLKANNLTAPDQLKMNIYMRMSLIDLGVLAGDMEGLSPEDLTMTGNMYYENGMYYTDMMGQKTKMPMPLDQTMQSTKVLMGVSTDYLQDMTLRTEGEDRILTYTMDSAKMNELLNQVQSAGPADLLGSSRLTFRNISGEYIINPQGCCTKAKLKMTMDMAMDGETMSIMLDGDVGFANPGQPVTITTPNLAEYTEAVTE